MATRKCSKSGKDRYPSKIEADLAIANVKKNVTFHRKQKYREEPTRSYRCGFCGGWHMTSRSLDWESA